MIEFLSFEIKMIKESFSPFEKFNETTPTDEVNKAINKLQTLSGDEDTFLKKVLAAQEAYASKNGFTIEKEKTKE